MHLTKRAIASSILPWRLGGSLKKRRRSQPKASPEKFPLCDRSFLPLCFLRLCGSLKKAIAKVLGDKYLRQQLMLEKQVEFLSQIANLVF
ncbi:MAG: hypothetical protein V7K41_25995 [Nostoc sp.]|uniref:hypothetical protein n=1 Tax=Nostoc sp. TaxID=1180 RepID=UPI002FF5C27E